MKLLIPESDNIKQGIATSRPTENEGKACGLSSNLYLLSTFQAWYSGYKNKLTAVAQGVDSVVVVRRPGA